MVVGLRKVLLELWMELLQKVVELSMVFPLVATAKQEHLSLFVRKLESDIDLGA